MLGAGENGAEHVRGGCRVRHVCLELLGCETGRRSGARWRGGGGDSDVSFEIKKMISLVEILSR